jgi:exopolysaccharide biosynthesis WecB/TagA/CpsF family protein
LRSFYSIETRMAAYPSLALPLARLRGEGELVDANTDLLVESFPRCASSFAVAAFHLAQEPRCVRVAHHVHAPGHVIAAIRAGVPALVLIREPEDVVVSNLIRHPERTVSDVLHGYLRFYEPLRRFREGFVIGTFKEAVGDFGSVIGRINARFGTGFAEFEATEANVQRCLREIDDEWRARRGGSEERLERIVPRPSRLREEMKEALHARFRHEASPRLRARADALFRELTAAPPPASGPVIFGVRLHERTSAKDVRATLGAFLAGDEARRVFTPNPEILLYARDHLDYAALLNGADLALPDGAGIALVQLVRTRRGVRRWPGIDLGELAIRLAAARGDAVMLVGGEGDVGLRAAARWRQDLPGLEVGAAGSGVRIGEDGTATSPEDGRRLIEAIRAAAPGVVLVAFGAPKQERWIDRHAAEIPSARIMIGVGGALDIWGGGFRRAPRPFHALGLEWAWRLAQQPSRLPRIARATIVFPWLALRERPGASGIPGSG